MTVVLNGKALRKLTYSTEKDFEEDIVSSSKTLFGVKSIYIDAKKKIDSKTLGTTVPDGFLFDFRDPADPQFYIVEVELAQHGFFNHIFPQITKFFAFFKNNKMQKALVDKLHSVIDTDTSLRSEFKKHLSSSEIYKFLSDIVETSQNILLIADGTIAEIIEINETYTDTWGRMVRFVQVTKHSDGDNVVYYISPDLEVLPYAQGEYTSTVEKEGNGGSTYTEQFHLDNVSQMVKDIYDKIKEVTLRIDENLVFNPQKYYISIKANKNIVFMEIRKKKIRFIPLLPEDTIRSIAKKHNIVSLSEPVQRFYNSPCASVDIDSLSDFDEIQNLILAVMKGVRGSS